MGGIVPKLYKVVWGGEVVKTKTPGKYAGSKKEKIFGRLDCPSGKRLIKRENRVFFADWEDAIEAGFRPCLHCKPHKIRPGERLGVFHPALDRSHIALWETNPRPDPKKPMVCFYAALNWTDVESQKGETTTTNQVTLENWFPRPTAIKKAIAWGKRLGLPVIDCFWRADNLVLYAPEEPITPEQFRIRRNVIAEKRVISLTFVSFRVVSVRKNRSR